MISLTAARAEGWSSIAALAAVCDSIETLLGFNMLLADTNLPTVPRGSIRNIVERDTLELLGINDKSVETQEEKPEKTKKRDRISATKEEGKVFGDG